MWQTLSYVYSTLVQEVSDQLTIVREILEYYNEELGEEMKTKKKIKEIEERMSHARSYKEWRGIASEFDALPAIKQKINEVYSPYYDYKYIQELHTLLKSARVNGKIDEIISILRSHSYRNIGNMNCPLLYRDAFNTSKQLIEDFQSEVALGLRCIMNSDINNVRKLEFFGQMRHAVGRSALLLSGGAILGMYHIGVVQTLMEADCMPKIIAGSSAGSIIASIIATHTREDFFEGNKMCFTAFANKQKGSLWRKFKRAGKEGYLMDIKVLEQFLRDNIGEYTFQQAYDKFGVILNITVTGSGQHDEDRLLNYLTAPNVLIWSASAASCAIPFIYGATDLYCRDHLGRETKYTIMNRKFLDGSIGSDLPMNKLSIFFNVNNFIVSQTNPWVIPFMDYTEDFRSITNPVLMKLLIFCHQIKEFLLSEVKHRALQMSFIFPGIVTKFFNLVTQAYVGNVTIWPVPSLSAYLRIMENPSNYAAIQNFVFDGRQRAYPKIAQIQSSLFLERQIDACYKYLRRQSHLNFLLSNRDIEDADEEEYFLKRAAVERPKKYRNESFMIPRQKSYEKSYRRLKNDRVEEEEEEG